MPTVALCHTCHSQPAVAPRGTPVSFSWFGEVTGHFCAACARKHHASFEMRFRSRFSDPSAPHVDLAGRRDPLGARRLVLVGGGKSGGFSAQKKLPGVPR